MMYILFMVIMVCSFLLALMYIPKFEAAIDNAVASAILRFKLITTIFAALCVYTVIDVVTYWGSSYSKVRPTKYSKWPVHQQILYIVWKFFGMSKFNFYEQLHQHTSLYIGCIHLHEQREEE